jgi:hypothetical protein
MENRWERIEGSEDRPLGVGDAGAPASGELCRFEMEHSSSLKVAVKRQNSRQERDT